MRVTDCAVLVVPATCVAKLIVVRDRVAFGPDVTPVPLRAIDSGLPTAFPMIVTAAVRGPI
jgi:hypothetical protein